MSVLHLELTQAQAKRVARLLANDTARTIMDVISEESKSESQIAKELKLALSTVHYNIKQLVKAGLVSSDEYTYSKKGKEVRHYKLASEHVIISTKPSILAPGTLLGAVLAVGVAVVVALTRSVQEPLKAAPMAQESADMAMRASEPAMQVAPLVWPWILAGAGLVLLGIILVQLYKQLRQQ